MNIAASCLPHPEKENTYLLFLELSASEEASGTRKPVHLALAIDASSSMGGPRLARAIDAARAVLERLGPEDTFCLLAFDRAVRVLFGPGKVDDEGRAEISRALAELKPGVGTALHAAIEQAHELLRRVFVRGTRPHVILLTDGYPSVGPMDPQLFSATSRKAAEEGIVTSAVGVGLDFDEQSVGAIATGGGGRYSFVDKASDIPGALLFAIAVENVTVRVSPASTVREARLLHRYPTKVGPDGFVVETGPIGRGNPRRLLFQLKTGSEPKPVAATIALTVHGPARDPNRILSVPVDPAAPSAAEAIRELWRLELSDRETNFWEAVHENDKPAAARELTGAEIALEKLEKGGVPAADLESDRARLRDGQAVLEGRLSKEAREAARKRSHHTAISRITSLTGPSEE
jgi:Ca-activated chloride channel family protein